MKASDLQTLYDEYYRPRLDLHGASPLGVDWNSKQAQDISFEQLIKLIQVHEYNNEKTSILDFGCGYGALSEYLKEKQIKCKYTGYDFLPAMILQAQKKYPLSENSWITDIANDATFDFVMACGVFTLQLNIPIAEWEEHVLDSLSRINKLSSKGFAFNCLTSYSDPHLMKDYLYYPSPLLLFDHCKKHFSKYVSLIHDYPKYEFTIIVRK